MDSRHAHPEDLWAITCFFNTQVKPQRLANYRQFRKRLNVPLVAVELSYGAAFELNETDADILIQIRSHDLLWQKERLLNLALRALPETCCKVAWIDCDVIFGADDWAEKTSRLLDRAMIVQPFSNVHFLARDWAQGQTLHDAKPAFSRTGIAFTIEQGMPANVCLSRFRDRSVVKYGIGYAWAARRELLERNGLYDGCIIGGGDRAIVSAAYGCPEDAVGLHCMNEMQRRRYLAWAEPFYEMTAGRTSAVEGDLFHLWHGSLESRLYFERHQGLDRFRFDPYEDVAPDDNGCWRWNSDKPDLHRYLQDYFDMREKDH